MAVSEAVGVGGLIASVLHHISVARSQSSGRGCARSCRCTFKISISVFACSSSTSKVVADVGIRLAAAIDSVALAKI